MSEAPRFGWLGAIVLLMAGCIVGLFAAHYWRGPSIFRAPPIQETAKSHYAGFQSDFNLPANIVVNATDGRTKLLSFEIGKPQNDLENLPIIAIKNLTDRAYTVSYQVIGYDSKKQRVGQASDSFEIGPRETVLRQPSLIPDVLGYPRYSTFRLIGEVAD